MPYFLVQKKTLERENAQKEKRDARKDFLCEHPLFYFSVERNWLHLHVDCLTAVALGWAAPVVDAGLPDAVAADDLPPPDL